MKQSEKDINIALKGDVLDAEDLLKLNDFLRNNKPRWSEFTKAYDARKSSIKGMPSPIFKTFKDFMDKV